MKTKSLNFPKWHDNYSRVLKSNYQWHWENITYDIWPCFEKQVKKCKHVYNKVYII